MTEKQRIYFCIDMKCFYASVECVERGLNPFETPLVVADETRGKNALCLAVSPHLKSLGVKNRCRLSEIPSSIKYIVAKPRMKKYIDYAADIYDVYLEYLSPSDIHVYSIDESVLDVTDYLGLYRKTPCEFAKYLLAEIAKTKRIPATCGIGTNLYLAKIALDLTAKKTKDGIGFLDEDLYKKTLWTHRPLSDFWQISSGISARLSKYGIFDMKGIAETSEELLYKVFGINAELLIDHAYGRESCTLADIKNYKSKSRSVSFSQILPSDYDYEKAALVMDEMLLAGCQEMMKRNVVTDSVGIYIGYSDFSGLSDGGTVKMTVKTNVFSAIAPYVSRLFSEKADKNLSIRRLGITFNSVSSVSNETYDLFTDFEKIRKEKEAEKTVLGLKARFGKNAVLRGMDFCDGATAAERNRLIGGHNGE